MKYFLTIFASIGCFLFLTTSVKTQDVFHITCEGGEFKVSGPLTEVHAECSKDLDATAEKNLCEMACIRHKEGLLDAEGKPSLEKHIMYMEKTMEASLREKSKGLMKGCFDKHGAATIASYESDKSCESSKDFNICMKTSMMDICK